MGKVTLPDLCFVMLWGMKLAHYQNYSFWVCLVPYVVSVVTSLIIVAATTLFKALRA
jgi:hypothetical protein